MNDNSTIAESNIKESSNLYLMKSKYKIINFAFPQEKLFIINYIRKHLNKEINEFLYSARKDGDKANNFH